MARRKHKSQLGLPEVDQRPREPQVAIHVADFEAMALGVGIGTGTIIVPCPVCAKPCAPRTGLARWEFLHRARIVSGLAQRPRLEPVKVCSLSDETMRKLVKEGHVNVSASDRLVGALPSSQVRAAELESEQANRD